MVAYLDCRRTKRNSASALAFEAHLERNLCALHDELASGTYAPGRSICFVVTERRPREVWAATFRDRIVHHLLYNHIAPRFYARFTADTCACIPGRGTLYAARRLEHQVRSIAHNWARPAHYLKCDLANFFVSIRKPILLSQLQAHVPEPWWMRLASAILMHDPRADVDLRGHPALLQRVPPHKSLFNAPADTGLPIGNLSSQFFANVLLNDLDQHAKHRLRAPHYVRYVDDFILLHPSAQWLNAAHADIQAWLPQHLQVRLNPRKTILQPVSRGVDFVGHVIKPWHRSTRRGTVAKAVARIQHLPAAELHPVANSYFGLLNQASHSHTDRARLALAEHYGIDAKAVMQASVRAPAEATKVMPTPSTAGAGAKRTAAAGAGKKAKPAVKYRHPATGQTWSGKGLQPAWLKAALANGKRLASFLTDGKAEGQEVKDEGGSAGQRCAHTGDLLEAAGL